MLSPWAGKGHRGDKMTKNGVCCHHGLVKNTAVTKIIKKWCMFSPWAARGHRDDKNNENVVKVATMGW